MKKSLIAVAVAGLFAAPVAMAEVTLSGAINLGIEISDSSDGNVPGSGFSKNFLNSNYSHVDMESVDDIGGGNKVIFHYQLVAQPQNTGGDNFNRNSFLGVAGTWGAFKMGTNENVYERLMYSADPLDGAVGPGGNLMILGTPGASTAFDAGQSSCRATSANGCTGFYRRTDNTIWYESPNWSGFTFEVDYTLSAGKNVNTDPTVISMGGKFQPEGGIWYVDAAYEQHKDMFGANNTALVGGTTGGTGSTDTGMQVGGGITFGEIALHLRYEKLDYQTDGTVGNGKYERDAYWFGGKYNLPSGYVGLAVGIANEGKNDAGTVSNSGAMMYGIGYFHNLSKQSQLQFIYGNTSNDDAATYTQAGATNGNPGADHTVIHAGLKHTF